ncbi:MAG: hypothetical protein WCE80_02910, partial [Acidimicrobiia bacterium]
MDLVLGGTQAVQDFAIHIDMAKQTDDGPVSFYQEVLDRAETGQGEPVDLAGDFTFTPTDSIEGREVDESGKVLPSLSVDFGLLGASTEVLAAARNDLVDTFAAVGNAEMADLLDGVNPVGARLLVEIVTADLAKRRTHVGPGDRSAVDITFVDTVAPGDGITSVYLFGETLPGDPAEESGLSAPALFTYRWNHGLISLLGGDDGIDMVFDETAIAVKGSTILSRETKRAALAGASFEGFLDGIRMAENTLLSKSIFVNEDGWAWYGSANGLEISTPEHLTLWSAIYGADVWCRWAAERLNAYNEWESAHASQPS